jgi:rsbT co-antagonist protein RsbR
MSETNRIEALETRVRELGEELERKQSLITLLFENNPDGVVISDASGKLEMNASASANLGQGAIDDAAPDQWTERYGLFRPDKVTLFPAEELPMARSLVHGETVDNELVFIRSAGKPEGAFMTVSSRPLPGGGVLAITRDVTDKRQMEEDIASRTNELAAREEENRELIARLRVAVDELSTPVLEIWDDVLALPVVGIVDTQRSAQMTERLLAEVVRGRAQNVIVDLTGVELIDTSTADRFLKLARSVQLLGARCIVTGIQPSVAQTLVELGVEFASLETHRNLKNALEACIRRTVAEAKGMAKR